MSAPVAQRYAPSRFLDPGKWVELRSFARNDLIALTYINVPIPDENGPSASPPGPVAAMEKRLNAMMEAIKIVQPALENFYGSLTDEQKARFNQLGPRPTYSAEGKAKKSQNK